ncbi:MAG: HAD family phosphatase [Ruminococcaceae bacterium]|nr:HAD family phosphatase [Oscillospiraceae bacterium]
MIRNAIFDFGQVLVHFEPTEMVKKYASSPEDAALLAEIVFDRLYWDRLDSGTISNEETIAGIKGRLPERLHEPAEQCYYNWIYNIPEIDGMRALLKKIKEEYGIRLFLLSNISQYFAEHAHEIPILEEFEQCFFSSVCGLEKPNPEFFEFLLQKCGLEASETIFVDDNANNIRGASSLGITTYQFDKNAEELEQFLDTLLK